MTRPRLPCRLVLGAALALACGDDGDDDTAGTTTSASADGSSGAGSTTAEPAATEAGSAESTGAPAECETPCAEGEICVAPGACAEAPFCHPPDMIICDFATGTCMVAGVCSGMLANGTLVCDTCTSG